MSARPTVRLHLLVARTAALRILLIRRGHSRCERIRTGKQRHGAGAVSTVKAPDQWNESTQCAYAV